MRINPQAKGNECAVVVGGFLAPQGDSFEAFELTHGLLDPGSGFVERPGEELGLVLIVGAIWNDWTNAPLARGFAVGFGVVSLVGQRRPGFDIGADVEQGFELRAVTGLAAGEMELERIAFEVGLEVDFRRESAARATERMTVLPPFAPAAETWARTTVLSNIWTRCAVSLASASAWKNASNTLLRLSRENRFQTLFQLPNSAGNARHETLLTVK
jgi:hypothetical protein